MVLKIGSSLDIWNVWLGVLRMRFQFCKINCVNFIQEITDGFPFCWPETESGQLGNSITSCPLLTMLAQQCRVQCIQYSTYCTLFTIHCTLCKYTLYTGWKFFYKSVSAQRSLTVQLYSRFMNMSSTKFVYTVHFSPTNLEYWTLLNVYVSAQSIVFSHEHTGTLNYWKSFY